MRSIRISALGLALAVIALGGCASTSQRARARAERGCINTREINMIRALDDEHILVKISANRFHMFTVDQPCGGLRQARSILIADAARRVCGDGTTLISFEYPAVGPTRCRIRQIEPVRDMQDALDRIESRAAQE